MKFYMVLRQTEEWDQLTVDNYWDYDKDSKMSLLERRRFWCFSGERDECKQQMLANLKCWDKLEMSFFEFRHVLKQMVMDWWIADQISIDVAEKIKDEDVILIPMDDDDLLKPGLLEVLYEIFRSPEVDAVTWKTWCHTSLRQGWSAQYYVEPNEHFVRVPSNCYAIRSNVATVMLLANHVAFSDDADLRVSKIDEEWGLRFIHPASMYLSQTTNTLFGLGHGKRQPRPPQLDWAADLIDKVYDMTTSLRKPVQVKMV